MSRTEHLAGTTSGRIASRFFPPPPGNRRIRGLLAAGFRPPEAMSPSFLRNQVPSGSVFSWQPCATAIFAKKGMVLSWWESIVRHSRSSSC